MQNKSSTSKGRVPAEIPRKGGISTKSKSKGQKSKNATVPRGKAGGRKPSHGMSGSPIYGTWRNMIQRCENPRHPAYKRYGARGVRVCDRWRDAAKFIKDMLPTWFEGAELSREGDKGDYKPGNAVWKTKTDNLADREFFRQRAIEAKQRERLETQRRDRYHHLIDWYRGYLAAWGEQPHRFAGSETIMFLEREANYVEFLRLKKMYDPGGIPFEFRWKKAEQPKGTVFVIDLETGASWYEPAPEGLEYRGPCPLDGRAEFDAYYAWRAQRDRQFPVTDGAWVRSDVERRIARRRIAEANKLKRRRDFLLQKYRELDGALDEIELAELKRLHPEDLPATLSQVNESIYDPEFAASIVQGPRSESQIESEVGLLKEAPPWFADMLGREFAGHRARGACDPWLFAKMTRAAPGWFQELVSRHRPDHPYLPGDRQNASEKLPRAA